VRSFRWRYAQFCALGPDHRPDALPGRNSESPTRSKGPFANPGSRDVSGSRSASRSTEAIDPDQCQYPQSCRRTREWRAATSQHIISGTDGLAGTAKLIEPDVKFQNGFGAIWGSPSCTTSFSVRQRWPSPRSPRRTARRPTSNFPIAPRRAAAVATVALTRRSSNAAHSSAVPAASAMTIRVIRQT
jgi:hypothetical protein